MGAAINPSQLFSQTGEDAFHLVGGQWQPPSPSACADEERSIALCRQAGQIAHPAIAAQRIDGA